MTDEVITMSSVNLDLENETFQRSDSIEPQFEKFRGELSVTFHGRQSGGVEIIDWILSQKNADFIFNIFDVDRNGTITVEEMIGGLTKLKVNEEDVSVVDEIASVWLTYVANQSQNMNKAKFRRCIANRTFGKLLFRLFKRNATESSIYLEDVLTKFDTLSKATSDEVSYHWIAGMLKKLLHSGANISLDQFKKVGGAKQNSKQKVVLCERIFHNLSGGLSTMPIFEFLEALRKVLLGTAEDKLKFLFAIYDLDGNGTISRDELHEILSCGLADSSICLSEYSVYTLTNFLWEAMKAPGCPTPSASIKKTMSLLYTIDENDDAAPDEGINLDQFRFGLDQHPEILANLSICASHLFTNAGAHSDSKKRALSIGSCQKSRNYVCNNLSLIFGVTLLVGINLALSIEAGSQYWLTHNAFVVVARMCGKILNLNSAIILLFVCRHCLTLVRATRLAIYLPIDQVQHFHNAIGYLIVALSLVHTAAHLGNFTVLSLGSGNFTLIEYLFTTRPNIGWVGGCASLTGWVLLGCLIIMFLTALPCVRRQRMFEIFYYTHFLFVVYEIILILHGPNYWKWLIGPGIIFVIDRVCRLRCVDHARYGKAYMKSVTICQSKVVRLEIAHQRDWIFKAGDYVFINIPQISRYEWHPFTISSAPEQKESFTLHIRVVGNWTTKLFEVANGMQTTQTRIRKTILHRSLTDKDFRFQRAVQRRNKVHEQTVDLSDIVVAPEDGGGFKEINLHGPYGSPSSHIFNSEHVVLISTGIGVTPYISILQSIFYRFVQHCFVCPSCGDSSYQDSVNAFALNRVDFYWINRTHKEFEWFAEILSDLEDARLVKTDNSADSASDFMGLHLFLTGARAQSDIQAVALKMALDVAYRKIEKDMLSGLKSRLEMGRPDWQKEFQFLQSKRKGKVTIFYCGAPILGRELKRLCTEFDFNFREEVF